MPLTFKEALMASHGGLYNNGHHLHFSSFFFFLVLCLDFVLCNQVLAEHPIRRNVQAEKEIANFL